MLAELSNNEIQQINGGCVPLLLPLAVSITMSYLIYSSLESAYHQGYDDGKNGK